MKNEFLECGQIMRAHGIGGAMVINHFCDSYEVFGELGCIYLKDGESYTPLKVKKCSFYKGNALVTVEGITSPEEVIKLRMRYVYAHRDDILKGEDDYFIADLIGLPVIDADTGRTYGTLKEVTNRGAQDLYVVDMGEGKEAYVPAVSQFVKEISLEKGIFITPIEGMLE